MSNKVEHELTKGNYKIIFKARTAAPETNGVILQIKNVKLNSQVNKNFLILLLKMLPLAMNGKKVNNIITYIYIDESGSIGVVNYDAREEMFVLDVPMKEGYEFLGWYTDEGLSGTAIASLEKGTTGEITLYAKWEKMLLLE